MQRHEREEVKISEAAQIIEEQIHQQKEEEQEFKPEIISEGASPSGSPSPAAGLIQEQQ